MKIPGMYPRRVQKLHMEVYAERLLRSMHHILSVAVAISLLPAVHSAAFTFSCSYHNLLRKDADTKCTERPSPRWRGRCAARLGADTPVPCPELIGTAATAFMAFDLPQVRTSSWSILLYVEQGE